jgi:hypothetical protein
MRLDHFLIALDIDNDLEELFDLLNRLDIIEERYESFSRSSRLRASILQATCNWVIKANEVKHE